MSNTIELKIKGMSCEHCDMRVEKALEKIEGVLEARADYKKGHASVTLKEDANVNIEDLIKAVNDTEIYSASKA